MQNSQIHKITPSFRETNLYSRVLKQQTVNPYKNTTAKGSFKASITHQCWKANMSTKDIGFLNSIKDVIISPRDSNIKNILYSSTFQNKSDHNTRTLMKCPNLIT